MLQIDITEPAVKLPVACRLLSVSRPTLIRMIERGDVVEVARVGRNRMIETGSIERYLTSKTS